MAIQFPCRIARPFRKFSYTFKKKISRYLQFSQKSWFHVIYEPDRQGQYKLQQMKVNKIHYNMR